MTTNSKLYVILFLVLPLPLVTQLKLKQSQTKTQSKPQATVSYTYSKLQKSHIKTATHINLKHDSSIPYFVTSTYSDRVDVVLDSLTQCY